MAHVRLEEEWTKFVAIIEVNICYLDIQRFQHQVTTSKGP